MGMFKNYIDTKKDDNFFTRIVLFEKCKQYDFERGGLKYWNDKNGKVIRIDNNDSSLDIRQYIGIKGESFLEAGYVYAPYIPLYTEPALIDLSQKIINATNAMSRYSLNAIGSANYIICSVEASNAIQNAMEELL